MGFGKELLPRHPDLPLYYDYRHKFERKVKTPFEEAVNAAKLIYQTMPKPITVCLSGGVDSQAVLLAFKAAKVPFNIVTFIYNQNRNHYDYHYAYRICEREALQIKEIHVDLEEFHEDGRLFEYAKKWDTNSPHMCCQIYGYEQVKFGTVIIAGNPIMPYNVRNNKVYRGVHTWDLMVHTRYQATTLSTVGFFLSYTPELHYSFIMQPGIDDLIKEKNKDIDEASDLPDVEKASYELKCGLFECGGFDIIRQPKKFHGFEWLKWDIEKNNKHYWKNNIHEYDRRFRKALHDINPVNENVKTRWNKLSFEKDK